jgi:SAM-dependent methyltransferase
MALPLYALEIIAPYLKGASVLCLGYPDILAKPEEVKQKFGIEPTSFTAHGGAHGITRPLIETQEWFRRMGATLDCVDIQVHRGVERVVDLNQPADLGQYDLVLDPGTTEHCFNIGQAILNAANAVKPGGRIYHAPPVTLHNHGFYNVCPTAMWDFYSQNGWAIERFEARKGKSFEPMDEKRAIGRAEKIAPDVSMICVAKRMTGAKLLFPCQSKYLLLGMLKKEAAA